MWHSVVHWKNRKSSRCHHFYNCIYQDKMNHVNSRKNRFFYRKMSLSFYTLFLTKNSEAFI